MKDINAIAIIPARGGSKGLPRKNILPLSGKPLIAWSIESSLAAKTISRVVVSTDDTEIAEVARHYGAEVVIRPSHLANDTATSESALLHALEYLKRKEGYTPNLLVFLQCTSPLTTADDIDNAVKKMVSEKADSCLTVKEFYYFLWKNEQDGNAAGINHDKRFRLRRQDIEPQYEENGAIYVMKTDGFISSQHRFFGKTVLSIMPTERCFEIDDPVDFKIAETLVMERENKKKIDKLPKKTKAILLDFDGVITDNKVLIDQYGKETVICDRSDGWILSRINKYGIKVAVLSTEENPVVSERCNKLGIECRQGLGEKKIDAFYDWCISNKIKQEEVVFIGNDVNDIDCLKAAGCGVVPADAHTEAKEIADIKLLRSGGRGAIREFCDILISNINLKDTKNEYSKTDY